MKKIAIKLLYFVLIFMTFSCSQKIKEDKNLITGTLENGFSYVIKENSNPKGNAYLQLIVKIGSTSEKENQLGLAHFLEHMAFNGTKSYKENQLIDFLESMGVAFGPDLNAYTSFDETVYKLQIPTDNPQLLEQAVNILKEWAFDMSLEDQQIEKERGIIIEEWRSRNSAQSKAFENIIKTSAPNSIYSKRFPIGDPEIIRTFKPQIIKDFYNTHYLPENMVLLAVGDFNTKKLEETIIEQFSSYQKEKNKNKIDKKIEIKDSKKYLVINNKELPEASATIIYKKEHKALTSKKEYKNYIISKITNILINQEINQRILKKEIDIISAGIYSYEISPETTLILLDSTIESKKTDKALNDLYSIKNYFLQNSIKDQDLEIAKKAFLEQIENLKKSEKTYKSKDYVSWIKDDILNEQPTTSISWYCNFAKKTANKIDTTDIENYIKTTLGSKDETIVLSLPTDEKIENSESYIKNILKNNTSLKSKTEESEENLKEKFLNSKKSGKIVSKKYDKDLKCYEYKLENGLKIIYKKTDFESDSIKMSAFSFGGLSLFSDKNYINAKYADNIIANSGFKNFSPIKMELLKMSNSFECVPYINEYEEGFIGNSTIKNFPLMLQSVKYYFTNTAKDETAFELEKTKAIEDSKNTLNDPTTFFIKNVRYQLSNKDYRKKILTPQELENLNIEKAYNSFQERFKVGDFVFTFVGNMTYKKFEKNIKKYLATINFESNKKENYNLKEFNKYKKGNSTYTYKNGKEQKAFIYIIYTGEKKYDYNERESIKALGYIIDTQLRKIIREEESGAYSPYGYTQLKKYPYQEYIAGIVYSCDPQRVQALIKKTKEIVRQIKLGNFEEEEISNYKKIEIANRQKQLQDNSYWLHALEALQTQETDKSNILAREDRIQSIDKEKIVQCANELLKKDCEKTFILLPAK